MAEYERGQLVSLSGAVMRRQEICVFVFLDYKSKLAIIIGDRACIYVVGRASALFNHLLVGEISFQYGIKAVRSIAFHPAWL